jgi:clan AA aspartic protease (TIGR02281 family)
MKVDGGVYVVPVSLNGVVSIDCIVDSGASDVNIPESVFAKLVRAGSIRDVDILGTRTYTLADGSTENGRVVRIKSLKVGGMTVNDVLASVGGNDDSALLGQSFLERFKSWALDNSRHTLVLVGLPSAVAPPEPSIRTARSPSRPDNIADGAGTVAQVSGQHGGQPPPRHTQAPEEPSDGRLTSQSDH